MKNLYLENQISETGRELSAYTMLNNLFDCENGTPAMNKKIAKLEQKLESLRLEWKGVTHHENV